MNKKLMALAVAGAVAPGFAAAQGFTSVTPTQIAQPAGVASNAGITLYGRLDETIMNQKLSATTNNAPNGGPNVTELKKADIYSPGNAMGIRGREDLGGGTAAWFQLEIGVNPSERTEATATTGNNWGGRNSGIGISSGVGDLLLGNWDTPYKVTYGVWNSVSSGGFSAAGVIMGNGDTTGALTNALCATGVSNTTGVIGPAAPAATTCVTEATSNGTAWSRRINNSVQYWSPIWNGLQVKLMTALATYQSPGSSPFASGLPKAKEASFNVTWASGPLSLGLGYDQHEGLRPGTAANSVPNPKDTAIQIGGKWNFGPGEIGVGFEQLKYGNNANVTATAPDSGMTVPSYVVNGRWNIGPGAVWATYSTTPGGKSCTPTGALNNTTVTGNNVIGGAACSTGTALQASAGSFQSASSANGQAKQYVIGYDFVLSKRTKLYAAYAKIDNGLNTNYYYIAGPAGNNANGTASGIQVGTDVTTLGVGVQHLF